MPRLSDDEGSLHDDREERNSAEPENIGEDEDEPVSSVTSTATKFNISYRSF